MPRFNLEDNDECQGVVNRLYRDALTNWNQREVDESKVDNSYAAILSKQRKYGVELANNDDFVDFTLEDWD